MDRGIIRHDNALSSWIALRVGRDGAVSRILKIETDLNLEAGSEARDANQLEKLVDAALAYVRDNPGIECVEIEQAPGGPLEVTRIGF
jgi:hypothetical protein